MIRTGSSPTTGGITKKTTVKRPTVSQALSRLLELEKIERIGLGRGTRYRKNRSK